MLIIFALAAMPQWVPTMHRSSSWAPAVRNNTQQMNVMDASLWDKEFQSQESSLQSAPVRSASEPLLNDAQSPSKLEADELARTAALFVEAVKDEQNPKFKDSQFLSLMRQIRDGEVIVEGNDMVERSLSLDNEIQQDVKGKGKQRQIIPGKLVGLNCVAP